MPTKRTTAGSQVRDERRDEAGQKYGGAPRSPSKFAF